MPSAQLFTESFLAQVGPDFAGERLGQDFVRASVGADSVRELLTWPALNEILSTHQLGAPRLRLFRDGAQVPVGRYTQRGGTEGSGGSGGHEVLVPDALYRELREGASLVLDSVDQLHPPVAAAADDLMRLVKELVQVNLYLVWGDHQGFDTHWDDHDTVIVQLAGTKHWTVRGPGRPYPMKLDTDHDHRPPDGTIWEGTLAAGDIIHVPRGWWHAVRGTGDMSMHLTFGFTRRTGIDWARWVVEQLYVEELFRQDLPRFADERRRRAHEDELVRTLAKVIAGHRPSDFLAARDRRFPRRPEINLPWPVRYEPPAGTARVELTALLEPAVRVEDGAVAVTVAGKTFRFAAVLAPLLERLAAERSVPVTALRATAGLDEDQFDAALELLLRHHLVVVRE